MIEHKITNISADAIGTERGDILVAQGSDMIREQYAADGKRVTRIEFTADHTTGFAVAEITIAEDGYSPAPLEFGDENELPAIEGEIKGDD